MNVTDFAEKRILVNSFGGVDSLNVDTSDKTVRTAVLDRLVRAGFEARRGMGNQVRVNTALLDKRKLAAEINSWGEDKEWLASIDRLIDPNMNEGASWWRLFTVSERHWVLGVIREGLPASSQTLCKNTICDKYKMNQSSWRNMYLYACVLVSKETTDDLPEYDAVGYAHGEECWNKLPARARVVADALINANEHIVRSEDDEQVWDAVYYMDCVPMGYEEVVKDAIAWRIESVAERRIIALSMQELHTVLAALRCWQDRREGGPPWTSRWDGIATNNLTLPMMTDEEVEDLRERINCRPSEPAPHEPMSGEEVWESLPTHIRRAARPLVAEGYHYTARELLIGYGLDRDAAYRAMRWIRSRLGGSK